MQGVHKRRRKYWFRFTWGGKQRLVNTGEENEGLAILKAQQILSDPSPYLDGKTELESLLADYLKSKRLRGISETHLENEEWTIQRFLSDTGLKRPRQVTAKAVSDWLAPYAEKNAKTADDYFDRLRRFLRYLMAQGRIVANPCDEIPRIKKRPRIRRRFLKPKECRKLLEKCQDDDLKTALYLALHAGLRKGECLAAIWSWIDLDAKLLHITTSKDWTPKDRDDRTIPITKEFAAWLKDRKGEPEEFLCWPEKEQGTWRNRKEFRKPFKQLCEECGFDDLTFHDLRRTFASLHVSAGTSIYKVARWLGDGVAVVEKYYGHLQPADDEINRAWK